MSRRPELNASRDDILLIAEIAKRAKRLEVMLFDTISLMMDLEHTHHQFDLRLKDLLEADDENFIHDIVGIQNHFNRQSYEMDDYFVPRYSKQ